MPCLKRESCSARRPAQTASPTGTSMSVCPPLSVVSPVIALRSTWHKGDGASRRVYDVRYQGGEPVAISDCMQMNACAENCIISGSRRGVGKGKVGYQG